MTDKTDRSGRGPQPLKPLGGGQWRYLGVANDLTAKALMALGSSEIRTWERTVWDGTLKVMVAVEPHGWHLSISHRDKRDRPRRYPGWDEITDARYRFTPQDLTFVQVLPPPGDYVAHHPTTFHLHQSLGVGADVEAVAILARLWDEAESTERKAHPHPHMAALDPEASSLAEVLVDARQWLQERAGVVVP